MSRNLVRWSILICMLWVVSGFLTRPMLDDLCLMVRLDSAQQLQPDAVSYAAAMYREWTGRYSTLLLTAEVEPYEPLTSMLIPPLLMLSLLAVLTLCVRASRFRMQAWLVPVFMAAWLTALPSPEQVWMVNNSVVYIAPLVVAGIALYGAMTTLPAVLLLPIALVAGGFSESQAVLLMVLPVVGWWMRRGMQIERATLWGGLG